MAGHHRVYYYLTGDARIGDAMADAKDADLSLKNVTYLQTNDEKEAMLLFEVAQIGHHFYQTG